jgi:hypothetical protein
MGSTATPAAKSGVSVLTAPIEKAIGKVTGSTKHQ